MPSFRDVIIFLAGVSFFHTLSHIFLSLYVALPLASSIVVITPNLNLTAIIANALITVLLLYWASRLKKR